MKARELKEVIRKQLEAGSGDKELFSLFVEGPPGIGKSEIVAETAREENAGCIDFRLLLRDPSDLLGIPYPDLENGVARWLTPSELPMQGNNKTSDTGILFFDDMTTAPPLMQACAYQITIPPHKIGEAQLKPGWIVVAAGNRAEDRALVHTMPRPLANRFTHVQMEVNLDDWVNWAVDHKIASTIVAFMHSSAATIDTGHLLFHFDPKKEEKAFPTPRSWARTSRILAEKFPKDIETELIQGTIGSGAAAQFSAFLRLFKKLPDVNDIIVNKKFEVTPQTGNMDVKYALVVAVAAAISSKVHMENALEWAKDWLEPEFGILMVKILGKKNKFLLESKLFRSWIGANKDLFGKT